MLDRICAALSLGTLTAPPIRLSGGYTHRMFRLDTTTGRYAVKLLNPEIMQRPDALDNYRTAEAFEALLEQRGLPILPALTIGGKKRQQVDGRYLYVFDYFDGRVLKDDEITPAHCRRMGQALAGIHSVNPPATVGRTPQSPNRPTPGITPVVGFAPSTQALTALVGQARPNADSSPTKGSQPSPSANADSSPIGRAFWCELTPALLSSEDARAEGGMLLAAAPMLARVTAAIEDAIRRLPPRETLCHNDMDAKNVLWQGEDFRIIDLECLGYADPRQELLDLAISWAGWPAEEARFKAFLQGYEEAGGICDAEAALLYDSRRNHIDWLEYNARRALFDDPEERRIGREQIAETIGKIESDQRTRKKILEWMEEIRHG